MRITNHKERVAGIALSYLNTFLNMAVTLLLVPGLLRICGDEEYAVYKVMASFTGPLAIMNFGVATYVSRAIAQCNQLGVTRDDPKRQRILGMSAVISTILLVAAMLVSALLYSLIGTIYGSTFSPAQVQLAKKLFLILALNLSCTVFFNGLQGCITGNEKFILSRSLTLIRILLRGGCIILIVVLRGNTVTVALCDLGLTVLLGLAELISVSLFLRERFRFDHFETAELKIFFSFSLAMLLQTVINSINNSIDNVLLGAFIADKTIITMYSSALTIHVAFVGIAYMVSSIYHPSIIKAVAANEGPDQLLRRAVTPAKIQAVISSGVCLGFILFGDRFIRLWIGEKYLDAYYVEMSLMVPSFLVSVSGIYEAFMDAKLKRLARSLILLGMAVYNVIVSVVLIRWIGFWGAAIGTSTSLIFGNLIIMNVYASKISGVSAVKLYCGAFSGVWPAMLLAAALGVGLRHFLPYTRMGFLLAILLFVTAYLLGLYCCLSKELRHNIRKKLRE